MGNEPGKPFLGFGESKTIDASHLAKLFIPYRLFKARQLAISDIKDHCQVKLYT